MNTIFHPTEPLLFPYPGLHCATVQICFCPRSDTHNTPVRVQRFVPRLFECGLPLKGQCFFVQSVVSRLSRVIFIEAPDFFDCSIELKPEGVEVHAEGCTVYSEECTLGDEEALLRAFLRTQMPLPLFAMVNNWGDMNGPDVLNEAFCLREIDAAAEIGLDVVQLDDGWQKGSSKAVRIFDENGKNTYLRRLDGDFWEVDREKFPNGLEKVAQYALSRGITPGLWFAPDARNHFGNMERDLAVLRRAVQMGFRYFKLDMIKIVDWEDRNRFVLFLEKVHALADNIYLQLDVTGPVPRLGFTDGMGYGKLFVENRFTKRGDYFPHLTLSNLWQLCRYIPAQHFQFELANRRRFPEDYAPSDPLAPMNFSAAWQFASVMVSCPLVWMEVQNLHPDDCEELMPLIAAWKQERDRMARCDVQPVGSLPDGTGMTGFLCTDGQGGYLIALSEQIALHTLSLALPKPVCEIRCLHTNTAQEIVSDGLHLTVTLPDKAAYAFYRFSWA